MVLNSYKASSRSICQMVLTELVEIRIPSQSRGRRKGPDCRNSSKNAWPGTGQVIQWLESTCQGRGHRFDPCSGKIQIIKSKRTKKKLDLEVEGVCSVNPSTSSNVGEVCTHLKEMGLEEKHWPHSWVDVMWTQTHLQKLVFRGDVSRVFSSPKNPEEGHEQV